MVHTPETRNISQSFSILFINQTPIFKYELADCDRLELAIFPSRNMHYESTCYIYKHSNARIYLKELVFDFNSVQSRYYTFMFVLNTLVFYFFLLFEENKMKKLESIFVFYSK